MRMVEHTVLSVNLVDGGVSALEALNSLGASGWHPWHMMPAGAIFVIWLKREIERPTGGDITEDQHHKNMAEHAAKLSGQSYSVRW